MKVSQLLLGKIYFNNELKVKFINLHETDGEISYEQNHKEFIIQVRQIFLAFQEGFNKQENYQTQKLTNISNQVLEILISNKYHKELKQFIKINITGQQLNAQLINDKIIDPLKFSQLFQNQQQSKVCNLNPDDIQDQKSDFHFSAMPCSQYSCVPSDLEVQRQLQFKQNPCQIINHNYNVEASILEIDATQVIENDNQFNQSEEQKSITRSCLIQQDENDNQKVQKQSKLLFKSSEQNVNVQRHQQQINKSVPSHYSSENNDQNVQKQSQIPEIKTKSNEIQQIQNNNQSNQKKSQFLESVQKSVDIKCSENQDSEVQFKSNISCPSKHSSDDNDQNDQSNISKLFNQDQNIKEINDHQFKEKLKKHLIKIYENVDEMKAQQLFQDSKKYYDLYEAYIVELEKINDENQKKLAMQFQVKLLKKFFNFIRQENLLDREFDQGIKHCQYQFKKWDKKYIQSQQKNIQSQQIN